MKYGINRLPNGDYRIGPAGISITQISQEEEDTALNIMRRDFPGRPWYVDMLGVLRSGEYTVDKANADSRAIAEGGTEKDPHGKSPNEPGAKMDEGKIRVALMEAGFPRALMAVAEVTTFGARKYTDHGWLAVPDAFKRYSDAAGRHRLRRLMGEERDKDSGLLHLQHEAWNLNAMLELKLREKEGSL